MDFVHYDNEIVLYGDDGKILANVTFPAVLENIVCVNHTFVDQSQRGKGVADKLMQELVKNLESTNRKAKLKCSYAIFWFSKNQQYKELIVNK